MWYIYRTKFKLIWLRYPSILVSPQGTFHDFPEGMNSHNPADWAPCVVTSCFGFCFKMALFESASKQLVKDTGRSSLHPVLDLNSSSKYGIMCVVQKKKSRWFWRKTKYLPTPFTLNEILLEVGS